MMPIGAGMLPMGTMVPMGAMMPMVPIMPMVPMMPTVMPTTVAPAMMPGQAACGGCCGCGGASSSSMVPGAALMGDIGNAGQPYDKDLLQHLQRRAEERAEREAARQKRKAERGDRDRDRDRARSRDRDRDRSRREASDRGGAVSSLATGGMAGGDAAAFSGAIGGGAFYEPVAQQSRSVGEVEVDAQLAATRAAIDARLRSGYPPLPTTAASASSSTAPPPPPPPAPAASGADAEAPPPALLAPASSASEKRPITAADPERMQAANRAALEIEEALRSGGDRPGPSAAVLAEQQRRRTAMGVCVYWSNRGYGILRCQQHGEVFVHVNQLQNTPQLDVGDVVTFELGFDSKRQKNQALNCVKAGGGAGTGGNSTSTGGAAATPAAYSDSLIQDAAAAASARLLAGGSTA
eukprot:TRINITY_DN12229_c0_g1_i2.p1 TRINITY_DN12229_c0_g1~~TRINITY_DN12229_c0_g1_i2.p1  ORF type:complete len:437 (+),score=94.68 TRINITY_DN12229_c0_g1_i2:85-1311(+)